MTAIRPRRACLRSYLLLAFALAASACTAKLSSRPAQAQAAANAPESVPTEVVVFPLANAACHELANTLRPLFGNFGVHDPGAWDPQPVIAADARTNSLVVRAAGKDMAKLRELIALLDRPVK